MRHPARLIVLVGVLAVIGVAVVFRVRLREAWEAWRAPGLPPAQEAGLPQPINQNGNRNAAVEPSVPAVLPAEMNLKVPFTSQAPHANWDEDHEEFCEEASVLMVGRYFSQRTIADKDDAEQALQQLKARELELFGYFKDTTAAETAQLLEDRYPVETELLTDPTAEQIRQAVAAGFPVIIPAAGRQLNNPNFKQPGPLYHMLVVKGYLKDGQFITNDPGTRKGADYLYPAERILTALHDWNGGDVDRGARVVIVVSPR